MAYDGTLMTSGCFFYRKSHTGYGCLGMTEWMDTIVAEHLKTENDIMEQLIRVHREAYGYKYKSWPPNSIMHLPNVPAIHEHHARSLPI